MEREFLEAAECDRLRVEYNKPRSGESERRKQ
jgi:hypothetical protein